MILRSIACLSPSDEIKKNSKVRWLLGALVVVVLALFARHFFSLNPRRRST